MAPIQLIEIKRLGATLQALRPAGYKRRSAAVVRADLEGYSRMMGVDEEATHRAVDGIIRLLRTRSRIFGGRITNIAGDGFTAEFPSAVAALKFTLEMQELVRQTDRDRPQSLRLRFRAGIHFGDIIVGQHDIFGDVVNVAARLETMAPPGGICISRAVYQQAEEDLPADYVFLGTRWLKNIRQPIDAYLLMPGPANGNSPAQALAEEPSPGVLPWAAPEFAPRRPELQLIAVAGDRSTSAQPVIAVLPFTNLGGNRDKDHLSEGLADDVASSLAKFRELIVVSRRIAAAYGASEHELAELHRTLGVQYVVHGSTLFAGDRIRISVQLSETSTGRQVWADRYELEFHAIFNALDGVVAKVMAEIAPAVELDRTKQVSRKPPETMRAYDCYLRGKQLLYASPNRAQAEQARLLLERAIELDPDFILPYGHLARLYNTDMIGTIAGGPLNQNRARAFDLAKRSLAIDPTSPLAHFSIGWCNLWRRTFGRARFHFDRVLALNPYDPHRLTDVATGLMYLGDHEAALAAMQRAMELNPYHPEDYLADLAEIFFVMQHYQEALELYDLVSHPTPKRRAWRLSAFAHAGRLEEARSEATAFEAHVRSIWIGDPGAGLPEFIHWLFEHYPFAKRDDEERFRRGLRAAGLPA
jgi:adenylate cyclase